MQLSPIAGSTLIDAHQNLHGVLQELVKGSGWDIGPLYINGAAWVVHMTHQERGPVELAVDIGDRDALVLKVQALI